MRRILVKIIMMTIKRRRMMEKVRRGAIMAEYLVIRVLCPKMEWINLPRNMEFLIFTITEHLAGENIYMTLVIKTLM